METYEGWKVYYPECPKDSTAKCNPEFEVIITS